MKVIQPTRFTDTQFLRITGNWGGGDKETPCGRGSKLENTNTIRIVLPAWIKKYEIKSLADIGAGDRNWMKHLDLSGIDYRSYDLLPRTPETVQLDVTSEDVPPVDAILCRHVLNHLPLEMVVEALGRMKRQAKYLILSTNPDGKHDNGPADIPYFGHFTEWNLDKVGLGPPLEIVEDFRTKLAIWDVKP